MLWKANYLVKISFSVEWLFARSLQYLLSVNVSYIICQCEVASVCALSTYYAPFSQLLFKDVIWSRKKWVVLTTGPKISRII